MKKQRWHDLVSPEIRPRAGPNTHCRIPLLRSCYRNWSCWWQTAAPLKRTPSKLRNSSSTYPSYIPKPQSFRHQTIQKSTKHDKSSPESNPKLRLIYNMSKDNAPIRCLPTAEEGTESHLKNLSVLRWNQTNFTNFPASLLSLRSAFLGYSEEWEINRTAFSATNAAEAMPSE